MYYIIKYGIDSHFENVKGFTSKKDYLFNLFGRILYVYQINKSEDFFDYQQYLRKQFDFL